MCRGEECRVPDEVMGMDAPQHAALALSLVYNWVRRHRCPLDGGITAALSADESHGIFMSG